MRKLSLLSSIFVITLFLASCGTSGGGTKGVSSKTTGPVITPDDTDGDGIDDFNADGSELDKCRNSLDSRFVSTDTNDRDGDGCKDDGEDKDDDNDGINDVDINGNELDKCPFESFTTDVNGDGCEDTTTDSDGDGIVDSDDACLTSKDSNFRSTATTDRDSDGCKDDGEDKDDDNDGVNDFEADGTTKLDKCPFESFTTDVNSDGCEDTTTDTDSDGVFDSDDACLTSQNSNFRSTATTDRDGDGCEDGTLEDGNHDGDSMKDSTDTDDDNDTVLDTVDACPRGIIGTSDPDADSDGCKDSVDVDSDGDGLIEIATATELNNIRHDLDGTHYDEDDDDATNNIGSDTGCTTNDNPAGCHGYELANNIILDVPTTPATSNWDPVGSNRNPFSATLEGNGFTISNLAIDSDTPYTGFFAKLGSSTVQNLSFVEGSVTSSSDGSNYVGVLVGWNKGGTIFNVSITGFSITAGDGGNNRVGGLVGYNSGGIIGNSRATGTANGGDGNDEVGGLVGYNDKGTIQGSTATGSANGGRGNDRVGGLVGYNSGGIIGNSYATGSATGGGDDDSVGGLVGLNGSRIRITFSGSGVTTSYIFGIIRNSYATGTANGGADVDNVGGLVGYTYGTIGNSYATGTANGGADADKVGGLVGYADNVSNSVTLQNSYSLGDVDGGEGADEVGRLLGKKGTGTRFTITITSNYYNSESQFNNGETELTLSDPEAVGKTRDNLKALTADITDADFTGDNNGWNAFNWDFGTDTQYPSLKSYKVENNSQVEGELLCGQSPEADFVQCAMP